MSIEVKNLIKTFGKNTVIDDISFKVDNGEILAIIGPSGSGKSTLVNMLYRKEKVTKGTIKVGGLDVSRLRDSKVYKLRRRIGVVFQDFKLLSRLNVYENVAFTLEVLGLPKDEIHTKVLKVLELVGLKGKAKNYPNELSGGEQQRVAIARSIVNGPKILICDEPTGNLDPKTSIEIMNVLEEINKLGTTIIMVTHDIDIVSSMKKRTILLDNGRILKDYAKGTYVNESIKNSK